MKKDLIEALRDKILFEINDFMLLRPEIENKILSIIDDNFKEALQKAKEEQGEKTAKLKEQPTLTAEEFLKSKGINVKYNIKMYNDMFGSFTNHNILELLTEYSQQNISLPSEEEIGKECWERYNLYNSPFWRGKREGFLECAKWMKQQIEKK
jgi:hypothetical protein